METKQWRTVDRSEWPSGEWDAEPDKMQFTDEATGLPCLIVRGGSGALCGYVGVTEGHPWFGKEYDACGRTGDDYIDVHGGLTFSNFCADTDDESKHICHVPGPGEPHRVWWLGFDCAHSGDWSPRDAMYERDRPESCFKCGLHDRYRTLAYVKRQVQNLAHQAKHEAA